MSIDIFLEEFKKIKFDPNITHYLFKNALTSLPEFKAFTDYIEFSKTAGNFRSDTKGMYVLHTDPTNHDLSMFINALELREKTRDIYGDEIDSVGITLLVSEYAKEDTDGATGITKHYDQQDTIHWACVGSSLWHIYKDEPDEIEFEYIVEPGDIMFAKKHIVHDVQSLSPRAACILTMHKNGVEYGQKPSTKNN
jgi:hypothetical protein